MDSAALLTGLFLAAAPGLALAQEAPTQPGVDDVRTEVRRVERLREPTPALLVQTARAAWDARLGSEALELLDEALGLEADDPGALAMIASIRESLVLELPLPSPPRVWELEEATLEKVIDATFTSGGLLPRAAREVAVWRLDEAAHPAFVRTTALAKLRDRRATTRAFAALVLRRLSPGEEGNALIERSLLDPDEDARLQSAAGLALIGDPAVAGPAVRALASKNSSLRLHAAEALGVMGYPEAIAPLAGALLAQNSGSIQPPPRNHVFFGKQTAYIQDYDVEVATGSSIADPVINTLVEGAVLDVRVIGVSSGVPSTKHRRVLRSSIEKLAGVELGSQKSDWKQWWATSPHNPANVPPAVTSE